MTGCGRTCASTSSDATVADMLPRCADTRHRPCGPCPRGPGTSRDVPDRPAPCLEMSPEVSGHPGSRCPGISPTTLARDVPGHLRPPPHPARGHPGTSPTTPAPCLGTYRDIPDHPRTLARDVPGCLRPPSHPGSGCLGMSPATPRTLVRDVPARPRTLVWRAPATLSSTPNSVLVGPHEPRENRARPVDRPAFGPRACQA